MGSHVLAVEDADMQLAGGLPPRSGEQMRVQRAVDVQAAVVLLQTAPDLEDRAVEAQGESVFRRVLEVAKGVLVVVRLLPLLQPHQASLVVAAAIRNLDKVILQRSSPDEQRRCGAEALLKAVATAVGGL